MCCKGRMMTVDYNIQTDVIEDERKDEQTPYIATQILIMLMSPNWTLRLAEKTHVIEDKVFIIRRCHVIYDYKTMLEN